MRKVEVQAVYNYSRDIYVQGLIGLFVSKFSKSCKSRLVFVTITSSHNHVISLIVVPGPPTIAVPRYRIFRWRNAPSSSPPLFRLDPPAMYRCILGEDNVSLTIDSSSDVSRISASTVYKLNLPSIFDNAGLQRSTTKVEVPTTGGSYYSILDLVVSYDLPSDVVLGSDWSVPCQPAPIDEPPFFSRPSLGAVRSLCPPHSWQATNGMSQYH